MRNGSLHDDVVQIVRDHGQRVFANLWTAGRVTFEFEEPAFPGDVKNFPPGNEDPCITGFSAACATSSSADLMGCATAPDLNGSPAHTRKGHELIS